MLRKLISGEFSLSETFWKFGVLGIIFFRSLSRVFEYLLDGRLKGVRIVDFYVKYFNPIKPDIMAILWTLCYLFTTVFFLYYCIAVWLGIWRSSAAFERSGLLKQLIRILMFAFVTLSILSIF